MEYCWQVDHVTPKVEPLLDVEDFELSELRAQLLVIGLPIARASRFIELASYLLDLLLEVLDLNDGTDDVEERADKPEHVVNVVAIVVELLAVLPEAHVVQIERMVREEVENECQIAEHSVENGALWRLLMQG